MLSETTRGLLVTDQLYCRSRRYLLLGFIIAAALIVAGVVVGIVFLTASTASNEY